MREFEANNEAETAEEKQAKKCLDVFLDLIDEIRWKKTSSRIKFMLQDVTDLTKNGWVARYLECLKTISQIHYENQLEKEMEEEMEKEMEKEMFQHIASVLRKSWKSRDKSDSEKLASPKDDQVSGGWRKTLHVVGEIENQKSTEYRAFNASTWVKRLLLDLGK